MKKMVILMLGVFCLSSCSTDANEKRYEPLYLNDTDLDVLFSFKEKDYLSQNFGEVMIHPADTIYCLPGGKFPLLQENGLRWSEKSPLYDVKLVFYPDTDSSKCLSFEGDKIKQNDIRSFSSYENIGRCDFCVTRGEYVTYGMLYRITEDMLKEAVPCD